MAEAAPDQAGISQAQLKTIVEMQNQITLAKERLDEAMREHLVGVCEHLEKCDRNVDLEDPVLALIAPDILDPAKSAEAKGKGKTNFFKCVKFIYLLRLAEGTGSAKKLSFGGAAFESSFNAAKLRKQVYNYFEDTAAASIPKATMADLMTALGRALSLCHKWGCSQETSTLLNQLLGVTSTCVVEWGIDIPTYIETMTREVWFEAATALEGGKPLPSLHSKSTYTQLFAADAMAAQRKAAAPRGREAASSGRDSRDDRERERERDRDRDRGRDRDRDYRGREDRRDSSVSARVPRSQSEPPAKRAKPELYVGSQAERLAAVLRDLTDRKVNVGSICTNFNAAKGCSYQNCKYTHVCLTCVKANRSEINHAAGSAAECK
jgi:Ni/Co efflux regulator RcnB